MFARTSVIIFVIVILSTTSVLISFLAVNPFFVDIPQENEYAMARNLTKAEYTGFSWRTFTSNIWGMYFHFHSFYNFFLGFNVLFLFQFVF